MSLKGKHPSSGKKRRLRRSLYRRMLTMAIMVCLTLLCIGILLSVENPSAVSVQPAGASALLPSSGPFSSSSCPSKTNPAVHSSLSAASSKSTYISLSVPLLLQNPELPTGCEATAAAMLLGAYGYEEDKSLLADRLPRTSGEKRGDRLYALHPQDGFLGNPFTINGYGVFPRILADTCQDSINAANGGETAVALSNATAKEILVLIDSGKPVCVWTTQDLRPIEYRTGWYILRDGVYTDEYFRWPGNEHCVVLIGYDADIVTVHDPMKGIVRYDRGLFFQRFYELGGYALFLSS